MKKLMIIKIPKLGGLLPKINHILEVEVYAEGKAGRNGP